MKPKKQHIIPGVILLGFLYWTADSVWSFYSFEINLRSLIFSEPRTLLDTFLLQTTPYQMASRITVTLFIFFGGWLFNRYLGFVRRSDEALRTSEAQLRSTFDAVTFPIVVSSYNGGRILFCNRIFSEMFFGPGSDPTGKLLDGIMVDEAVHAQALKRLENEEQITNVEMRVMVHDAAPIWGLGSYARMVFQKEAAVFLTLMDITSQKEAEAEARLARQKWQDMFENAVMGFYQVAADGRFKIVNPRFAAVFGYESVESLLSEVDNITRLYKHPAQRGELVGDLLQTGVLKGLEAEFKGRDGRSIWLKIDARLVVGPDGETWFEGFMEDVTEARLAKEALEQSERKYKEVVENSNEGIVVVQDGFFKWFNQKTLEIMGRSKDALKASLFTEFLHPDDREMVLERHFRRLDGDNEPPSRYSFRIIDAEGLEKTVELSVAQITWEDRPAVLCFISDISRRKRDEEEKEKLEAQLRQAQKMEAVGTLAGGVSHDFNNILQAINGYTQLLLLNKTEDEPEYKTLTAIQDSSDRAAGLVRQLLLFSRKADADRKPVDVNEEARKVFEILERTIPKMIRLELHLEENLPFISADPIQIEQILLNLGANAADAMPDGGELMIETQNVRLDEEYARTHLGAAPGNFVMLTVSDNGHGMDKETVDKIFEPFFTTKELGKGTGLGLASVYGIVKSHNGYIMCYSEIGLGTTFKIYLPVADSAAENKPRKIKPGPPKGGTETILVADDDEAIRDFAVQALERFGYSPLSASSGEEALEVFTSRSERIDLVILDLGMPGMGGHNCLQELVKIDPAVKVLVASGYSINGQLKKTMEAGASGYVGKPYQLSELLEKIRNILDGNGSPPEGGSVTERGDGS